MNTDIFTPPQKQSVGTRNQRRPVYIRVHLWFQYLAYFLALKQTSRARLSFTLLP